MKEANRDRIQEIIKKSTAVAFSSGHFLDRGEIYVGEVIYSFPVGKGGELLADYYDDEMKDLRIDKKFVLDGVVIGRYIRDLYVSKTENEVLEGLKVSNDKFRKFIYIPHHNDRVKDFSLVMPLNLSDKGTKKLLVYFQYQVENDPNGFRITNRFLIPKENQYFNWDYHFLDKYGYEMAGVSTLNDDDVIVREKRLFLYKNAGGEEIGEVRNKEFEFFARVMYTIRNMNILYKMLGR